MAGSSSVGDEKSIRKRFTASIKRVMSLNKNVKPGSSSKETPVQEPTSPPVPTIPATASTPIGCVFFSWCSMESWNLSDARGLTLNRGAAVTTEPKIESKPKPRTYHPPKFPVPEPPRMSAAERAQELFKKHNLDISTVDWPLSNVPQGERVQKDIRMRVHRSCHKCGTTYTGADKVCSCGHRRCTKCPRNPWVSPLCIDSTLLLLPSSSREAFCCFFFFLLISRNFSIKKSKDKGKGKEKIGEKITRKKKKDYISSLTLPSRTGGQDLVRKAPRQRVHRKCHRCSTDFASEKICRKCNHHRCKTCPREPLVLFDPCRWICCANFSFHIDSKRTSHLDTTTDLTPVIATEMSLFLVARSEFIRNHVAAYIGLVESAVHRSNPRRPFVKDVEVKRPKLEFVIRKSTIQHPSWYSEYI